MLINTESKGEGKHDQMKEKKMVVKVKNEMNVYKVSCTRLYNLVWM